jgi:hypothetical protein
MRFDHQTNARTRSSATELPRDELPEVPERGSLVGLEGIRRAGLAGAEGVLLSGQDTCSRLTAQAFDHSDALDGLRTIARGQRTHVVVVGDIEFAS